MKTKAYAFCIDNNWIAYTPKEGQSIEDLKGETLSEQEILNRGLFIRPLEKTEKLKEGDLIVGQIGIEQETCLCCFLIEKIINKNKINDFIENILLGYNLKEIDADIYRKIYKLADQEKCISSIISNGFAVNRKYIIYGKKGKEKGTLIPPFYIKKK